MIAWYSRDRSSFSRSMSCCARQCLVRHSNASSATGHPGLCDDGTNRRGTYLSSGAVSPGSSSWRCAQSGAMPLLMTCSWKSRRSKAAPCRPCTSSRSLQQRHLAEEVAAVGRVVGAALGLLARRRRRQVGARLEEPGGVVDRPLAGVLPDAGDEAADARQRFAGLGHPVARVSRRGSPRRAPSARRSGPSRPAPTTAAGTG